SQIERLSSRETKIAARLDWMAVGASGRSATVGMDVSRVGGFATSLCQSSGRYPCPHGIFWALVEHFLDAEPVHVIQRGVGEAFAVGRLVVDDSDPFALELVASELGPQEALVVVA